MKVQDVKKGMKTPWWVAVSDAKVEGHQVTILVEHIPDGGREPRHWNLNVEIPEVEEA